MGTILITTSSFAAGTPELLDDLKDRGFQYVLNPYGRVLTGDELVGLLDRHRPVGILAGTERIDGAVLGAAKDHLRVISRVGVGWDNVDLAAAAALGIRVYRTEHVLTQAVAELTLGMILSALRNLAGHDRRLREARWQKQMGSLLAGKLLGVIGFGAIGQRVGTLARTFGAEVIYYDPCPQAAVTWAGPVSRAELMERAEIISLHAGGREVIMGDGELKSCRRGVILINTARGTLVDERALVRHLASGQVGFACLDVFEQEPYAGPLLAFDNVLLTPHIGSYAREARAEMESRALANLYRGLKETGCL